MTLSELPAPAPPPPRFSRNTVIAGSVIALHVAVIWALQTGLIRRAVEVIVPVQMLSEFITPPAPKVDVPQPPVPVKQPVVKRTQPTMPPAPQPVAIVDPAPAPNAPTGVTTPQPPAPPVAAPVAVAPAAPAAPPAPPKVDLPSSEAAYLNNPSPTYPPLSKRLGEQGRVQVRVLIGADGSPQRAEIARSSGYDRLDKSAIDYVMRCRYVPGKVGGVAQAMWYTAPVSFVLE